MNCDLYKAKRINNGEWIEGYLYRINEKLNPFIMLKDRHATSYEVADETVCRCVGKEYMDAEVAFQGDIFESQADGTIMIVRYGTYQVYCPADKCYMDSVGFYAEAEGLPPMPIGDLSDYALKIGNIFDNPELLQRSE